MNPPSVLDSLERHRAQVRDDVQSVAERTRDAINRSLILLARPDPLDDPEVPATKMVSL